MNACGAGGQRNAGARREDMRKLLLRIMKSVAVLPLVESAINEH